MIDAPAEAEGSSAEGRGTMTQLLFQDPLAFWDRHAKQRQQHPVGLIRPAAPGIVGSPEPISLKATCSATRR